jgi:hypothetical protein
MLLLARLAANSMDEVNDRLSATVFVVQDVAQAGQRTNWAATLVGGSIVTARFFEGEDAPVITKVKAIGIHKELYISQAVRANHPAIAEVITKATRLAGSKWKMIETEAAFVARYVQANKSHRGPNVIAILSRVDSKEPLPLHGVPLCCLFACLLACVLACLLA